ncbi:MAG TPA: sigma factor-like helix-turn-helix DNA-binding protein [Gemmataceae bacterium]|nr:sigma factor-like helix-turn-helix DNA-binding protein [Gemmataceae bacterium]
MDSQRGGEQWRLSPELEAELRQTLLRLRTEGVSNPDIAEQLMRSPAVLDIVHEVTKANSLKALRGKTPKDWWLLLRKNPELRDEWRWETVVVLDRRLRAALEAGPEAALKTLGDPEQNVAGYWRMKVTYAAIKAASILHKESRFRTGYDRKQQREVSVECFDPSVRGGILDGEDKRAEDDSVEMELRLDLAMLIDRLEDPRQREVMRLSLMGYDYKDIAPELGISEPHVLDALEQARRVLWKGLGNERAIRIDRLEDPRQREVMWLSEMERYNYPEIGAKLGLSYEQVRYAVEKARKQLDGLRPVG